MSTGSVEELIRSYVERGLVELTDRLRPWAEAHLVTPRRISVMHDPEGVQPGHVWLVTDDTGSNDAAYRVVYDEGAAAFGLECRLQNGVSWYIGSYGSFVSAVESM